MKQLTEEEAIGIAKSEVWKDWTDEQVVKFQIYQDRLCMDLSRYQTALESVLSRPFFIHEFAKPKKQLIEEYEGKRPKPTLDEIIRLIPEEKRIIVRQ